MRARRVSLICNSLTCQVKFPLRVGCAADSAQKTPSPLRGEAPDLVPDPILQDLAENEMCFAGISLSLSLWRASQNAQRQLPLPAGDQGFAGMAVDV